MVHCKITRFVSFAPYRVLDSATGNYDADATPSTGSQTPFDFYRRLIDGEAQVERGDHSVF